MVSAHDVDVVLMDVQMPELDGVQAAQQIREITGDKARGPIIAITANTSDAEIERVINAGMNGFVGKPFRYEQLLAALEATLNDTPPATTTG